MTGPTRLVTGLVLSIAVAAAAVLSVNALRPQAGLVGTVLVPGLLAGLVTGVALRPIGARWPALLIGVLTGAVLSGWAMVVRISNGFDAMVVGAILVVIFFAVVHIGLALAVQRLTGELTPAQP